MKRTLKTATLLCLMAMVMLLMVSCDELLSKLPLGGEQTTSDDGTSESAPCGHSITEIIPAVQPTCSQIGYSEGLMCVICGENLIPREAMIADHNAVIDEAITPTCTQTGLTEGLHCSVCGEVFVAQEVIPAGHIEVVDKAVMPTCTQTGLTQGSHCSVCGEILVAQEIISNRHTEVIDEEVKSTCTQTGLTQGSHCSVCGEILVAQEIIPSTHHYVSVFTKEDGYIKHTCSNCGDSYITDVVPRYFEVTEKNREMVGYTGEANESLVIPAVFENDGTWYRVESIDDYAFNCCRNLTSVTIPNSVTRIGNYVFGDCNNITSITIPDGVTSIGDGAFQECDSLTSITIPDGVTSIGFAAFLFCRSLTSITIPVSVTSIGERAFECGELESIIVVNGNPVYYSEGNCIIERESKILIQGCKNSIIPQDIIEVGRYALARHGGLTNIKIPNSVIIINWYAFAWSHNLTSLTIPDGVTVIGYCAFECCSNLTSITIPDSVTSIGYAAFSECNSLTSITFNGTMAQWDAIKKNTGWNYNVPATEVICSDGTVTLN